MSELEMLFERFDGLIQTAADVRKLEQAILQWAVMGRLVPQDPTDEPASVLLKRIAAEKARLVKEKKIRKGKKLAAISAEEIPFKVPANWSWVRFDELINFLNGYAFKSRWYVQASHNQVIRLGNVKNSGLKLEANPAYIPQEQAIQHEKYRLKINDILITMTGTRGKRDYGFTSLIKAVDTSEYRLYLNQRVGCIRTIGELRPRLTSIFLKSEYFISQLLQDETGTANQGNIGSNALRLIPFPLPPLAEQKRIVAKVDELLGMCDRLAAGLEAANALRGRLQRAAVGVLVRGGSTPTQPPPKGEGQEVVLPAVGVLSGPQTVSSKGEGQEVAIPIVDVLSGPQTVFPQGEGQEMALSVVDVLSEQEVALPVVGAVSGQQKVSPPSGGTEGGVLDLLFAQFNALHTSPAQIDTLKQTILQLAVMGRLVPQDPTDEPASRLLERIADARNSWISDGKKQGYREAKVLERKSKQPLPQLPSSVRLPNGWQWTTVLHANCIVVDCHNKTAPYIEHGIPLIRTSNIRNRGFRWKNLKYISQKTYEYWSRRCPPMAGDILFTREAPIGEASIVPDNMTLCMGQRMMLIRPFHELLSNKYLLYVMTSPNFLARLTESSIGATVKHLRVGAVETAALPLPPFKEQKRIVAKVDELLGMCDRLAAGLVSAETARTQLLDALLARA